MWIGLAFSLAALAGIFLFIDPASIWAALRQANLLSLLLATLLYVAFLLIRAVRWRFMLASAAPYDQVFHIQNIGYMLNYVLPLRLGDVARAALIGHVPPLTVPQGISTTVVERLLDLLFVAALLPLATAGLGVLSPGLRGAGRTAGILALAAIATLILAANQHRRTLRLVERLSQRLPVLRRWQAGPRLEQLLAGLHSLTRWRRGLALLALTLAVWLPVILGYQVGMQAVGLRPSLAEAAFVMCAAALSIAAPSSPGQIGVFHASVIFALTQVLRQPAVPAASFAFLWHGLNFAVNVAAGLAALRYTGSTWDALLAMTRRLAGGRV